LLVFESLLALERDDDNRLASIAKEKSGFGLDRRASNPADEGLNRHSTGPSGTVGHSQNEIRTVVKSELRSRAEYDRLAADAKADLRHPETKTASVLSTRWGRFFWEPMPPG
jgi:hypothetical protein